MSNIPKQLSTNPIPCVETDLEEMDAYLEGISEQESGYSIIDDEITSVEMTATLKDIDDFIQLRYGAGKELTKAIAYIGIEVDDDHSDDMFEVEWGRQDIEYFFKVNECLISFMVKSYSFIRSLADFSSLKEKSIIELFIKSIIALLDLLHMWRKSYVKISSDLLCIYWYCILMSKAGKPINLEKVKKEYSEHMHCFMPASSFKGKECIFFDKQDESCKLKNKPNTVCKLLYMLRDKGVLIISDSIVEVVF